MIHIKIQQLRSRVFTSQTSRSPWEDPSRTAQHATVPSDCKTRRNLKKKNGHRCWLSAMNRILLEGCFLMSACINPRHFMYDMIYLFIYNTNWCSFIGQCISSSPISRVWECSQSLSASTCFGAPHTGCSSGVLRRIHGGKELVTLTR